MTPPPIIETSPRVRNRPLQGVPQLESFGGQGEVTKRPMGIVGVIPALPLWYRFSPLLLQRAIWPATRFFFSFFGRWEVRGVAALENLPRGVIFSVNHSSELDPILVPAALPFLSHHFPMFYTSREQSFYKTSGWRKFFYGGMFFKLWGAHPLRAGSGDYATSLATHAEILRRGGSLCVFPEGRKTRTGEVGEGHGGVAFLAEATGLPVVPVRIQGVFRMTVSDFFLRRRQILVSIGDPLRSGDLFSQIFTSDPDRFKKAAAVVMSKIRDI